MKKTAGNQFYLGKSVKETFASPELGLKNSKGKVLLQENILNILDEGVN